MAEPREFSGANVTLGAPAGLEDIVTPLRVHNNGRVSISCWKLSEDELKTVNATGLIWVSVQGGRTQNPIFVSGLPLMERYDCDGKLSQYDPDTTDPLTENQAVESYLDLHGMIDALIQLAKKLNQ